MSACAGPSDSTIPAAVAAGFTFATICAGAAITASTTALTIEKSARFATATAAADAAEAIPAAAAAAAPSPGQDREATAAAAAAAAGLGGSYPVYG